MIVPHYIETANVSVALVRFKWDDWNVEQAEEPIQAELLERLDAISLRASAAFAIATAEWIVHRFRLLNTGPLPDQYLESAWAQIIDSRYQYASWDDLTVEGEWAGPVKGPIRVAMTRVAFALDQMWKFESPELRAAWIANLAEYILLDSAPYLHWKERTLLRFQSLFKRTSNDLLGEVIPREALDPAFQFNVSQTEGLINGFLASLDYRSSPFLSSPEKMIAAGFEGTPYVFDIEKEREERLAW